MKKWLRNKLLRFLEGPMPEAVYPTGHHGVFRKGISLNHASVEASPSYSTTPETSPILNFRVYGATGGWVLEFSKIDRNSGDRTGHSVNVVANHETFIDDVTGIIQLELLRV